MTDIVTFLTVRLAEDEQAARAADAVDPTPWRADAGDLGSTQERSGAGAGIVVAADEVALWDCEGSNTLCMTAPTARHIARYDPARILAEVAAKRAIVEWHAVRRTARDARDPEEKATVNICWCGYDQPCTTIRHLAAVNADHPDYDESWRP